MSVRRLLLAFLNHCFLLLFAVVFLGFGLQSAKFLEPANLINILVQSSSLAVVAAGMTFVLVTAGVDLSVGAIMFVGAGVVGKMALAGAPLGVCLAVMTAIGLVFGGVNALFITRLRILPFIVTLATLYFGRGLGLWITQTRALNLPESFLQLGAANPLGVPMPLMLAGVVLAAAHLVLTQTPFGRQVYAVGNDREAARKAGIHTQRILVLVYLISGLGAALGGIISLAQLGAVSPTFGQQREFSAIAAAVLGGTSLFGGRGKVFPGTVLGAVLIQTVENGLVILNANPYLYPLITSSIIFLAVLIDSMRCRLTARLGRRKIRVETAGGTRT
jgi:ribose transport system permease protein